MVTGEQTCPVEIKNEEIRLRNDLETSLEEADNITVKQALQCARKVWCISVVSDDNICLCAP